MTSALLRTALAVLGFIVLAGRRPGHGGGAADGPPPPPHQFYGTVTLNGAAAPDGTLVSAEVNGVEAKTGSTREGKYGYEHREPVPGGWGSRG